ncbi:hypothetical protein A2630_04390 [Candidatus Woesebacteria bacterium RIFCSPHIGHO2_01_FULL_44_10]|uniref:Uncharacterized protein n=1 Tax=Candidatus Woesebacteria bacterium RIFCSPLOWO2_01_FULL_44_14 TaxID=1802525 RepID=A0A1F8C381_9BACT|nr:MAG: hypothetical protein A2630_04390 [Candidatus Woesebacteria bacterium RIFCSPHIGHO2_01_FULL_44_10]OGM56020.1 MAG: hypothetical protein A3F62_03815 [Candidatus Woesebacteria bacterium RIFCSPHIGHO2_12_FULL_44_11]OGM70742.1 MAG: hypothetical protein A2975_02525 [Candidatus Woesebacteria bacterium RIFCSPLOWO2_01_FULL_44_14]
MTKKIIILVSLLAVATVILAIDSSAKGAVLASLENESVTLEKENRQLKDDLVSATSLTNTQKIAEEAGLIKPEKIIYLNILEPVASLQ